MTERDFVELARKLVVDYANEEIHKDKPITEAEVNVVWLVKALKNNKAMLSTTRQDGMYYEVTYNGNKDVAYVDAYAKQSNRVVVL